MLGLALVVLMARPQTANAYEVMGAGLQSCGTWTADHRFPNSVGAIVDDQWVIGFLSAFGYEGNQDPLRNTDYHGVVAWIGNYCAANPIKQIITAAETFALHRALHR